MPLYGKDTTTHYFSLPSLLKPPNLRLWVQDFVSISFIDKAETYIDKGELCKDYCMRFLLRTKREEQDSHYVPSASWRPRDGVVVDHTAGAVPV